jgi:hypothetical protein
MDEEEKYLNQMAKQGLMFKKYTEFGIYHFEKNKPEDLHYRVDYRTFKNKNEFDSYVVLLDDAGWNLVYGNYHSGIQYFLPKNKNISDELFSDVESKAERYKRFNIKCMTSLCLLAVYLVVVIITDKFHFSEIGLFWKLFLIEVPLILLRTVPVIILFVMAIIYGCCAYRAKKLYKESLNKKQSL